MGRYTFLEDVALAACAIEIEGRSLDDLFETAAAAIARLMVDPGTLVITVDRRIELEAAERDLLLHDWLSEMIFLKDRDALVFPHATVRVTGEGPYRLTAGVQGGIIDPRAPRWGPTQSGHLSPVRARARRGRLARAGSHRHLGRA